MIASTRTPDPIRYLDGVAASGPGRRYKQQLLEALELRPGQTVVDVGCGPGTDLADLAAAVTDDGAVLGVDRDATMIEEARRRTAGLSCVQVRTGDAYALPLTDASVDRARVDRVLMHLAEPARALIELRRVIRPGGLLALVEPDWDTLAIDDVDLETSRAFTRFVVTNVRNGTVGRQLARLAADAGFAIRSVTATAVVFREFDPAEQILGLRRNAERAVRAGILSEAVAREWLDRLRSRPFLASFTFFTVTAQVRP